jgi:hypothetical protein
MAQSIVVGDHGYPQAGKRLRNFTAKSIFRQKDVDKSGRIFPRTFPCCRLKICVNFHPTAKKEEVKNS